MSGETVYPDGRLILMMGLPYAGKTVKAREIAAAVGAAIVNPDAIRYALHGHRFIQDAEEMVWLLARLQVRSCFHYGYQYVVLDACNVSRKRRDEWRGEALWEVQVAFVSTEASVCRERAKIVDDVEILPIIYRMARELEPPHEAERLWGVY